MNVVRRSIAFSVADKYLTQGLLIATTAIMARILTPAETGLFLTANAIILLADNLRYFGVGIFIVQEPELSRTMVRSAFTVTFALSFISASVIYLCTGLLASFYGSPELEHLCAMALLGFLLVPFSSPIIALLQRDLAFKTLAIINVVSALAGSVLTVGCGMLGVGAMSYVYGYLGTSIVVVMLALVARPDFWAFRPSLDRARAILSFGTTSSLITVSNMAYELLPRLAFGKILGFDAVGLYSRAVTISQLSDRMLVSAMQPVILPALAAHIRAGGNAKDSYLRGITLMSAVQWPSLIMLALLADPVVRILLGSQWGAAPPLVRVMALSSMALAPSFLTFPVLVSAGRIRDALWASLISLPPSFLIAIGAAFLSLQAVATSFLIIAPLQMVVGYLFVQRAIDVNWGDLLRALRESAVAAVGTAAVPGVVVLVSPSGFDLNWTQTIIAIIGGGVGWLVGLHVVDHPLKHELASIGSAVAKLLSKLRLIVAARWMATTAK